MIAATGLDRCMPAGAIMTTICLPIGRRVVAAEMSVGYVATGSRLSPHEIQISREGRR
jgi:hypothetical protein